MERNMDITVFGPGCAKCFETENMVRTVAKELGIAANITKVADFKEMMKYGVMSTPAIAIDGKVVCAGRVPVKGEVKEWLENSAGK